MVRRLQLHNLLVAALGSNNVYYQPDENIRMTYPAIVYNLSDIDSRKANNISYTLTDGYLVTHIDRDPDSAVPKKLALFKHADFETKFVKDGLHHTVFNIYY